MKFFKFLTIFLLITINQSAFSKPIPPGSGVGDIPANILILLDSSDSMHDTISGIDNAIHTPRDVIELSDGNIIISQEKGGLVKLLTLTGEKDDSFAEGNVNFMGSNSDPNCGNQDSSISGGAHHRKMTFGVSSNVLGHVGKEIVFVANYEDKNNNDTKDGKVIAIDTSGKCFDVIDHHELGVSTGKGFNPGALTIKTIDGEDHLFVSGRYNRGDGDGDKAYFYTKNLTKGITTSCDVYNSIILRGTNSITVADGGTLSPAGDSILYAAHKGHVWKYLLKKIDDGTGKFTYCPITNPVENQTAGGLNKEYYFYYKYADVGDCRTSTTKQCKTYHIQLDPDDSSIMYITGNNNNLFQKVKITGSHLIPIKIKGEYGQETTVSDAIVNFNDPLGIHVTSTNIWVTDKKPSIQKFNKNDPDLTWLSTFGGKGRRIDGAINAIKAVVTDTSFTSSANFGYGYWNSGIGTNPNRHASGDGGQWCYSNSCDYFHGWDSVTERSVLCNVNSCLKIGISNQGYSKIPEALATTSLAWGTDALAFAELASDYYTDPAVDVIDPHAPCQLNYVIVISDGEWKHHNEAAIKIQDLRTSREVKTLVVAYGDGIKPTTIQSKFDKMAIAGSCDDATGAHKDCEKTIIALTPEELKTQLQSKVQQIIADRLSFTAPSITATIQKGGSLYQAQFNYEQHGEWQGTILRKAIGPDGTVIHDSNHPGNWNAAEEVKAQGDARNIWTVLPTIDYKSTASNWNNFITQNSNELNDLFELTNNTVLDYHNTSSSCVSVGENGKADDIKGLISFVRGKDYFDYDGDCIIDEQREHVLGDIYNSQLIEVGEPNAYFELTNNKQESFWRAKNNYAAFRNDNLNRQEIVYAGANDGMLHAFSAETGKEVWAFVPPFIAAKLPTIFNVGLDGKVDGGKGGSNAIFGVDGSPVVHDMYFKGLDSSGTQEINPSWHTILIAPYGRGGAGFSVLDITNSLGSGKGPLHMYSIYNDSINNIVYYADKDGNISKYGYIPKYYNINESKEATKAKKNQKKAIQRDGGRDSGVFTEQNLISSCQGNNDTAPDKFHTHGTNACYKGNTFTFEFSANSTNVNNYTIIETKDDESKQISKPASVDISGGKTTIRFNSDKVYNSGTGSEKSSRISIKLSDTLTGVTTNDYKYDYSQLGETWSTPRVFRMPIKKDASYLEDKYVAVMGSGMGAGSNVFIINLEDSNDPGSIVGSKENKGPIKIIDTDPEFPDTSTGSNIANAIPGTPIVVTPDSAPNIPWRGAMVYVNDLEGKITKINLTNSKENSSELYDQTTLFKLNASTDNGRYSYFSLDATIGLQSNQFFLFGGTGNFERINETTGPIDNIVYGIKDKDFPYFKFTNDLDIPRQDNDSWIASAAEGTEKANHIDNVAYCKDTTSDTTGANCPTSTDEAWVFHLDNSEKVSGPPTVYKGNVYVPIYKPPDSGNKCSLGSAYICSANDECGTNNSSDLAENEGTTIAADDECYFVRAGILSELVIFGDTLYGNVAGPTATEDTLVSILSGKGDVNTFRRSWRHSF
jgi:type IV pilus assembly protein PilY1